ncbi:MAG TPA: hypothetical protein DCQ31_03710, partial [Bacteroidales bacterium]|nr:hypothetical protein [Bacteroidales bacterium]
YNATTGEFAFINESKGEFDAVYWEFSDGFSGTTTNVNYTFPRTGWYTAHLVVYNLSNNCFDEIYKEVYAFKGTSNEAGVTCNADFTYWIDPITGNASFTNLSVGGTSFVWNFGNDKRAFIENPTTTYTEGGMYEVCLTIKNESGCISTKCYQIKIEGQVPVLNAAFNGMVTDANLSINLADASAGEPNSWYWVFSDGTYAEGKTAIKTFEKPGYYQVSLIVYDAFNQVSEVTKAFKVGEQTCTLQAAFKQFINANNEAEFTNNSLGITENTKFRWEFGDGNSSEEKNPKHLYAKAGYYFVTLSVMTEVTNCVSRAVEYIQVGEMECKANFEFTVDPANRIVNFRNKSKGVMTKFYWDFGDNTFTSKETPDAKVYTEPGYYYVTLIGSNEAGTCWDSYTERIQVGTINCEVDFTFFSSKTSSVVTFSPIILKEGTYVAWDFGDGSFSSERNTAHTYAKPGIYTVGLNTYNANTNCLDYTIKLVEVGTALDCQADFSYLIDESTQTVTFIDNSFATGTITKLEWKFGTGESSIESNPRYTYVKGGYYPVTLIATASNGIATVENMTMKWIYVPSIAPTVSCLADFSYSIDNAGLKVKMKNTSRGDNLNYTWNIYRAETYELLPDMTSNVRNPEFHFTVKGIYLFHLLIENSDASCKSNAYYVINVADDTKLGLQAGFGYNVNNYSAKAKGYPTDLVGSSFGNAAKAKWKVTKNSKKTDETIENVLVFTHILDELGSYNVCLELSDPVSEQIATTCRNIMVSRPSSISFTVKDGTNLIEGATVKLKSTGESVLSNAQGLAVFNLIGEGQAVEFEISKAGYTPVSRVMNITQEEILENVTLSLITYSVTFQVLHNGTPLAGFNVTLGNQSTTTDANGYAVFGAMAPGSYNYQVSKDGFQPYSSTVVVQNTNLSVSVKVIAVGLSELYENKITLAPNPAFDYFVVEIPSEMLNGKIEIINALGQRLYSEPLNSIENKISLDTFDSGIYFVKLTKGNILINKKLVVKK